MQRNRFGCSLKLILAFFVILLVNLKYQGTIMYVFEQSPLPHELSYFGLLKFSHSISFL
jgi:hypothetical protein